MSRQCPFNNLLLPTVHLCAAAAYKQQQEIDGGIHTRTNQLFNQREIIELAARF
jgi:hypothetical protein